MILLSKIEKHNSLNEKAFSQYNPVTLLCSFLTTAESLNMDSLFIYLFYFLFFHK